jgi:hypothetical protein
LRRVDSIRSDPRFTRKRELVELQGLGPLRSPTPDRTGLLELI